MTTTRQQILRSSTPGQIPAAGTRAPGELWTTFPDLQLGVVDASKTAQKLIAVRFFSSTANYSVGDFVIQAGVLYAAKAAVTAGAFNASQWTRIGAATDVGGPYLSLAGGTLTGPLLLAADPGVALGAATKQYVDGKVIAGTAAYVLLAGGTMLGKLTLAAPPTAPLDAATKAYVDSGAFVPIAGGTMTGPLLLNADPAAALGAATRQYVDAFIKSVHTQYFIAGGTYTPSAGLKFCLVEMVGGGGGGGGVPASTSGDCCAGGGGGSGGYSRSLLTAAQIGASQAVTIGAGGAGGAAGANAGAVGTATSVGALCKANGGTGGTSQGVSSNFYLTAPGGGGVASGAVGDLVIPGADGYPGISGAGSAGAPAIGGNGGASYFGGAPAGGFTSTGNTPGAVGAPNSGSGGSGAASANAGAASAGGAGAKGMVWITEYCTQ